MTTTETSARSIALASSNKRTGRANQTSTVSNLGAARNGSSGAVDQTSARSKCSATNNERPDRADQTSTAPMSHVQLNESSGAVNQTSARSKVLTTSKSVTDRADPTSTAPNTEPRRNGLSGAVDRPPVSPKLDSESKTTSGDTGPTLADPVLGVMADVVEDLEMVRIANENRLRALTSEHGLTLSHPDVACVAAMVAQMNTKSPLLKELGFSVEELPRGIEQQAILNMNRVVRRHPLWEYMKPIAGVGEKQFARLLAVIRDPYWNDLHDRPRTMRELRAYCGWHVTETGHADNPSLGSKNLHVGVAPKRQRGQQSNWNDEARKRTWLIASSCIKEPGRNWPMPPEAPPAKWLYRRVYESARDQYEDTVHPTECVRCGPKGEPAQVGSPRSAGHQHAMALRKVAVAFLADLWWESKRLHEQPAAQIQS